MGVLTKISGLWRWDGDDEPVTVSRRSFFFMGGMAAVGTVLWPFGENNVLATMPADYGRTQVLALYPDGASIIRVPRGTYVADWGDGGLVFRRLQDGFPWMPYHHIPNASSEWLGLQRGPAPKKAERFTRLRHGAILSAEDIDKLWEADPLFRIVNEGGR